MIYRLRFCNKDGIEARVDIQKGLATPVVEVEGTDRPFVLSYNNDKGNKSGMFLSSSADIEIYETTDFNIDNLKTSNETELAVTYYINNIVKWKGFIIPDFFSIEVRSNPVIVMTASDRLGTLKSVTLSDLPSMVNIRELAVSCLNKTGLTLTLKTMADFSNGTGINDFFNSKILTQRLSDTKGRSISCYDILSSILTASNSKLLQRGGEWVIINKIQHEAGSGKLFSSATSFINWSDVIFNFSDISIGGRRTIIPVAANTGVYHEHGGGRLHPDNYDFSKGLTGWTSVGGFVAAVDNKEIKGFTTTSSGAVYTPVYGDATEKSYLINENEYIRNVNPKYIESEEISIPYSGQGSIEVEVNVNALAAAVYATPVFILPVIRIAVVATNGSDVLTLDYSGKFVTMPSTNPPVHEQTFEKGEVKNVGDIIPFLTEGKRVKGTLEVSNLEQYKLKIRIYGTQRAVYFHSVDLLMRNMSEAPKGTIFKIEQGSNYTKEHEIDTSIWGDYMTGGLNGYFYKYPIDDTSSLYNSSNELTSKWTAYNDTEQLPLLQHVSRQKSRLFSIAHDLLSAEIEVSDFDPLAIFVSCGKRYTVVSAQFDFFKSNLSVELEEVAFQNNVIREYIYSYFGEGDGNIKSIGGISGGSGGGGTGGGLTPEQLNMLADVSYLAHTHENKTEIDKIDAVVNSTDNTVLSDDNILTSLRVIEEILKNNETIKDLFLSKVDPDTAQEIIKFVKGIEIGAFTTGPLGAGAAIKMENGVSRMEVDQLDVRMRATFKELIIESLKHIGGQLILSPARMKCNKVVDGGTYYKCYFDTGDGKVSNEFVAGDQARCQVFTGSGVKMYWRLVTSVGTDWINLSKTDAISGSSIPEAGDDIVQLGNRSDATRQNAQILSTVGSDAPSWKQYKGINAFSLEGKDTTVFSGTGNKIDGKTVFMSSGANVEDGINSKNSNYSSQPTSYKANDTWTLSADQTVNGIAYKSGEILTATQDSTAFVQSHWVKKVRYTDDTAVNNLEIGGRNLFSILNTQIGQSGLLAYSKQVGINGFYGAGNNNNYVNYVRLSDVITSNGVYTVSFQMRGTQSTVVGLYVSIAGVKSATRFLTNNSNTYNERKYYTVEVTDYTINSHVDFHLQYAYFYIKDIKVEKGNKPTDWTPAPEDVDAKIADTKLYVEYSTDGTSWHTTFQTNDIYMRQKTGVNGTWTGAIKIVGKDGTSVNIKGKVSTSASLPSTANLGDGYITEDTGHLWVWTGSWTDAGQIQGDNGADSYIHIAYADNSLGGGFSHDPAGKSWIGIYADFTAIDSDNPGDYTWMYAKGDTGESAPLLYLSASAQVMKCNPDNTPQAGQTISIEAKLQNVSGTATFVATPYNDAGTAQTVITLGGTGNTRTLTNAQWLAAYKRIEVVATLGSLTDKVTIYRVADGATGNPGQNAIVGLLTNESVTLQANSAGVVSSFTTASGEFYVYNGTTKVTSGITFSKVSETGCTAAITSSGVYSVSAMSADNATVVLRAVYNGVTIDKVLTLSKSRAGADGVSITLVDVEFAKNTTPGTAPTTGWTTTAPTLLDGEQLWTRTKTTYSAGNPTYSTPANITPKKGETGAVGQGIDSVTEEYAISASKTVQPTTGWSTTQPAWIQGQYIWSRVKVVYKNPAQTIYTGYAVSSEWEAVNNMEIGTRNLLVKSAMSKGYYSSSGILTASDNVFLSGFIEVYEGKSYTAKSFNSLNNVGGRVVFFDANKSYISRGVVSIEEVFIIPTGVSYIRYQSDKTGGVYVDDAIIVAGNKAPTTWSPAPEDVQAAIDAEKTRINDILSDNVADPSEKQYLSNLWQEIYAEYPRIWAQASTYAIDKSNYEAKYTALDNLLSPVLANLTVNSTVAGASIRTAFSQYYDARIFLQNAITNKVNSNASEAKLTAEQAQLAADGYMRARYVRDWLKGNTDHNTNNWSEIKVVNKAGVNLALGKIPTANGTFNASFPAVNITDNNTTTQGYIPQTSPTENYVQIDLGQIYYDIDYIGVWHAGWPTRLYYGTKTEISVDGVNWTPVFDSAKSGTYKETAAGNIISFRPNEVLAKVLRSAATTDKFSGFDGGLATAVIMEMREPSTTTRGDATAGISGIQKDINGNFLPAVWTGGTYAQAVAGTAKAIIRHDGASKFTDAEVEGKVTAKEGKIGDMSIINGALTSNYSYFTYIGAVYVQVTIIMNLSQNGLTLTSSYGGTTDHPQVVTWTCKIGHTSIKVGSMEMRRDGIYRDGTKIL